MTKLCDVPALAAWLLLMAWAASPSVASAQVPDSVRADTGLIRLEPLRIQAVRAATTVGGTSAVEAIVDSLRLPAAPVLGEVLRTIPFLQIRTNSRGEAEITARGSETRQVAVLFDGVPLTLSWDGRTDLSIVPAIAARELRFVRGLASVLHGPNVLGGVVEIESTGPTAARGPAIAAGLDVDAIGGLGGSALATLPAVAAGRQWLFRSGAGWRRSPGSPLARGVAEAAPSPRGLRLNTDARHATAFAAARYQADAGPWLATSFSTSRGERGIAAELGVARPRFWRYPQVARTIAVVAGGSGPRRSPFGGTGDLSLNLGLDVARTEIDSFTGPDYTVRDGFENGDGRTLTLRMRAEQTLGRLADVRLAGTVADILHDERVPQGEFRYRQAVWSVGTESVVHSARDGGALHGLRLTVGAALDGTRTLESGGRPALDPLVAWGVRVGASTLVGAAAQLHAGVSRRSRFPTLREMYSDALDRFAPNPGLGAEQLSALEAGATSRIGTAELQLIGFYHRLDDAIVRALLDDGRFMRRNAQRVRTAGVELMAVVTRGDVAFGADLTLQSGVVVPEDRARGRVENLPRLAARTRVDLPLPANLRMQSALDYRGARYCMAAGTGEVRLAGGGLVDLDVARQWNASGRRERLGRIETRLVASNVTNRAIYDQCGLPQSGRLYRLQLRVF